MAYPGLRETAGVLAQARMSDPRESPVGTTSWLSCLSLRFRSSADPSAVRAWLPTELVPDRVLEGFEQAIAAVESYELPEGMCAVGVWYD